MTTDREQIIAAAKEVDAEINIHGPDETTDRISMHPSQLKTFYATAFEAGRVAEREECAKVCDESRIYGVWFAKAIRARSTK